MPGNSSGSGEKQKAPEQLDAYQQKERQALMSLNEVQRAIAIASINGTLDDEIAKARRPDSKADAEIDKAAPILKNVDKGLGAASGVLNQLAGSDSELLLNMLKASRFTGIVSALQATSSIVKNTPILEVITYSGIAVGVTAEVLIIYRNRKKTEAKIRAEGGKIESETLTFGNRLAAGAKNFLDAIIYVR